MNSRPSAIKFTDSALRGKRRCPQCGDVLLRESRSFGDRILGFFTGKHNYRCRKFSCRWEGALPSGRDRKVG